MELDYKKSFDKALIQCQGIPSDKILTPLAIVLMAEIIKEGLVYMADTLTKGFWLLRR